MEPLGLWFDLGYTTYVKLVRVTRDQEAVLWPAIVDRVTAFSRTFGADPSAFVQNLWTMFATKSLQCGVWAMVGDANHLVGHAITTIEAWNGEIVAWVHQVKTDTPAPQPILDAFLADVSAWVAEWNTANKSTPVVATLFITTRETEAWARRAGFDKHRIVYRRPIRST